MYGTSFATVSNKATWTQNVRLRDRETTEPLDLSGCSIVVEAKPQGSDTSVFTLSTSNGFVTIPETGVFQWTVSSGVMSGLRPGIYRIGATISRDGVVGQIFIGEVNVVDGVVS